MENQTNLPLRVADYLIAISIGSLSAVAVYFAVSPSWNMLIAMLAGMALAMFVAAIIILPYSLVGGIFEVIMPGMFIANIVGMATGMWVAMSNPPLYDLLAFGFIAGLLINGIFSLYDRSLHGEMAPAKEDSLK